MTKKRVVKRLIAKFGEDGQTHLSVAVQSEGMMKRIGLIVECVNYTPLNSSQAKALAGALIAALADPIKLLAEFEKRGKYKCKPKQDHLDVCGCFRIKPRNRAYSYALTHGSPLVESPIGCCPEGGYTIGRLNSGSLERMYHETAMHCSVYHARILGYAM